MKDTWENSWWIPVRCYRAVGNAKKDNVCLLGVSDIIENTYMYTRTHPTHIYLTHSKKDYWTCKTPWFLNACYRPKCDRNGKNERSLWAPVFLKKPQMWVSPSGLYSHMPRDWEQMRWSPAVRWLENWRIVYNDTLYLWLFKKCCNIHDPIFISKVIQLIMKQGLGLDSVSVNY